MPTYLLESYGADRDDTLPDARRRAMRTAESGVDVRYLRTTFLRGEQTLLHAFQAASPEALDQAARRAELSYERIIEALEDSPEPATGDTGPVGVTCEHKQHGAADAYQQIET
jgi:pyrrolidone-carboxylate peptidase